MSALRPLSIGVVGAGDADPIAAIVFAYQGHNVHVFERHPQLTVMDVGLLVQPQGIRALEALDMGHELEGIDAPIDRLVGLNRRDWRLPDIDYVEVPDRAAIRHGLLSMLYDAGLHAGAAFYFGCVI